MKKTILFAVMILALGSLTKTNAAITKTTFPLTIRDNQGTPPPAVLTSFRNIFGNVPVREWKARSHNQWRAHFINRGIAWEATFTSAGVLVKSEPA